MSFRASYASSKASRASVIVSSFFSSAPSFSYCSIIFARDAFNVLRLFVSYKRRLSLFSDEPIFTIFAIIILLVQLLFAYTLTVAALIIAYIYPFFPTNVQASLILCRQLFTGTIHNQVTTDNYISYISYLSSMYFTFTSM